MSNIVEIPDIHLCSITYSKDDEMFQREGIVKKLFCHIGPVGHDIQKEVKLMVPLLKVLRPVAGTMTEFVIREQHNSSTR